MSTTLSRQQRRAMERCAAGVDRATAADERYFRRFPKRGVRLRRASPDEIGTMQALQQLRSLEPGQAHFVVVRQIGENRRRRLFISAPAALSGDEVSERLAGDLFDAHLGRAPMAEDWPYALERGRAA